MIAGLGKVSICLGICLDMFVHLCACNRCNFVPCVMDEVFMLWCEVVLR